MADSAPSPWKTGQPITTHTPSNSGKSHLLNTSPVPCSCLHGAQSLRVGKQSVHSCKENSVCLHSPGGRRGGRAPPRSQNLRGERRPAKVQTCPEDGLMHGALKMTSLLLQEPGCILVGGVRENLAKDSSPQSCQEGRVLRARRPLDCFMTVKYTLSGILLEAKLLPDNSASLCQREREVCGFPPQEPWLQCFCQRRVREDIKANFNSPHARKIQATIGCLAA